MRYYLIMHSLVRYVRGRWYLMASLMISLNLLLFIYLLFPNPVLFIEQIERRSLSLEDMVRTDHPLLKEFAEEAYIRI
ncbi:MAG: hypothetical protein U9M95_06240 [Candidatus Altiarchaeota archaeon]|nr:hypothetical protein [Candidatus Altiarchaeota archaeon]